MLRQKPESLGSGLVTSYILHVHKHIATCNQYTHTVIDNIYTSGVYIIYVVYYLYRYTIIDINPAEVTIS